MRTVILLIALLITAPPVFSQQEHDPDMKVAGSGDLPKGWLARLDRPTASLKSVKIESSKKGLHITSGPAAIYYNPEDVATGTFRAQATFAQLAASRHPEAYGLFFGGSDLQGEGQHYLYFLIRQDGKYLIKRREGAETATIVGWTENPAVKKIDEEGRASNELAVALEADSISFLVNGKQVDSIARAELESTDGQVGLRVNHNLDVQIEGFEVKRSKGTP